MTKRRTTQDERREERRADNIETVCDMRRAIDRMLNKGGF